MQGIVMIDYYINILRRSFFGSRIEARLTRRAIRSLLE